MVCCVPGSLVQINGSHCSFLHDENVFNVCGNADPNITIPYRKLRENSRLSMMFQLNLRTMIISSRLRVLKKFRIGRIGVVLFGVKLIVLFLLLEYVILEICILWYLALSSVSVISVCLHPVGAISVLSSANSIHFKFWLNLTGSVFK